MRARAGTGRAGRGTGFAVAALGVAIAGAGCCPRAHARPERPAPLVSANPDHTVVVSYDPTSKCPILVDGGASSCGPDKGCIRVKHTDVVAFQATGVTGEEFQLQFGPFKHEKELTSSNGRLVLPVDVPYAGKVKTYVYHLLSATRPGCTPVDPQIIVDN